jgi:molybdopterin/thiamine biosynthesis adenylyltransferase
MNNNEHLGDTLRALAARGFAVIKYERGGGRVFAGNLQCSKGEIPIRLELSDWDFTTYPRITLTERPSFLPALMAHVSVDGELCYFAQGSVVLDRYDPAASVEQCLDQAKAVLEKIASDPKFCASDLENEFIAHWLYGQGKPPWPVDLCCFTADQKFADYYLIDKPKERRVVVATDYVGARNFAQTIGGSISSGSACKCWMFRTAKPPVAPTGRMPATIKELFTWLKKWDHLLYRDVQRVLEREPAYLEAKFATFAVDTPIGWLGFGFDHPHMYRLGYRNSPSRYKQFLHGKGGDTPIFRLDIADVRAEFIHSRNLAFRDLRNKRITLVGCGAIGGYVAQALVRLGAGTGEKGELLLIDPDTLGPENLGRHYLGMGGLYQPKADALRIELNRQFPYTNVRSADHGVQLSSGFFTADLIIDATGEEALSEKINGYYCQQRKVNIAPILYVWIKGNGEGVQALLVDGKRYGCLRCLKVTNAQQYRAERFPILKRDPDRRNIGCRSFTPYAVSAPMHAATLATDIVIDWMQGSPSPRFRTRYIENADVKIVKNQNISPLEGCPACRNH